MRERWEIWVAAQSKLEDDDERGEVSETDPLWSVQITAQALVKYKGERQQDH